MATGEQNFISDTTTRDNFIQLLNILKQRSLSDEMSYAEVSELMDKITNSREDTADQLRRSKRSIAHIYKIVIYIYRLYKLAKKVGWKRSLQIDTRYSNTRHGQEKAIENIEGASDTVGNLVDFLERILSPEAREEHVTERQQVRTEVPQVTEASQITKGNPVITNRQNAEEEQVTTEKQPVTEVHQAPDEQDNSSTEGYFTEKGDIPLDEGSSYAEYSTEKAQVTENYSNISLHLAAEQGNLNAVKYFVEKGADVNEERTTKDVTTPLYLAATNGYLDIVKYLVEKGAHVDVKGGFPSRTTILQETAKRGHLDIAKYLLQNGADVWNGGVTVVWYAMEKGDLDLIKYILELGLDINTWVGGKKFLEIAIEKDLFDVAIFLLDNGADIRFKSGDTYLQQAVKKNNLGLVRHLIEKKGTDVNFKDKYNTSVRLAVESGNLDLIKYLVEKGAHINAHDWFGTPLHTAVDKNNLEVVKYLVNAGTDMDIKDGHGNTPLHLAAENNYLDIVKYLIEKGANPEATDDKGKTPVQRAAYNCHLDIVEHLIGEEQQVTEVPQTEESKEVPKEQYVTKESQVICDPNSTLYTETLHSAAKYGELHKIKCLLAKGVDINAKDESGLTPLHEAVIYTTIYSSLAVVKYLVENGADINARSETGRRSFLEDQVGIGEKRKTGLTPLHYAVMHGNVKVEVKNGRIGDLCVYSDLDVVKYLVKKGADLTARTENGETPLDLARSRCNPQVVEFLSHKCGMRNRRDLSSNSWTNNSIVNWVKGVVSSTESLLISKEQNNHTVEAVPNIDTTIVNNTIILGILAAGLFNKTRYKQPIHENLLSPREQSMRLNNIDEDMIIRAIQQGEEKFGGLNVDMDEVKVSGNMTGVWKNV